MPCPLCLPIVIIFMFDRRPAEYGFLRLPGGIHLLLVVRCIDLIDAFQHEGWKSVMPKYINKFW
jgi:hypothetical protein